MNIRDDISIDYNNYNDDNIDNGMIKEMNVVRAF